MWKCVSGIYRNTNTEEDVGEYGPEGTHKTGNGGRGEGELRKVHTGRLEKEKIWLS